MRGVSVRESVKFGFRSFFKHILFFLGTSIVSVLAWFAGLLCSALVALPFFIPVMRIVGKLKEVFAELKAVAPVVAKSGMPVKPEIKLALERVLDLASKNPYALGFAAFGVVVFILCMWAVSMMLTMGWIRISLDIKDTGSGSVRTLFVRPGVVIRALIITILSFLIIVTPWVLSAALFRLNVVLGAIAITCSLFATIYLGLKLAFSLWFLSDRNLGTFESIKASFGLRNGPLNVFLMMLLFAAVTILIGMITNTLFWLVPSQLVISVLGLFVQFIISIASIMAFAYLYRGLLMRNK
ncbi:hypothetical protein ACFLYU_04305 [Candidatus Dependentiae bacterium]